MKCDLPLFRRQELAELKERRRALLKRVQSMPKYTPGRPLIMFKLQQVTAEVMKLELELYGRAS